MKLVIYSLVLNHHQASIADEFYKVLGDDFVFVETAECHDQKGSTDDYSQRPYLKRAWSNVADYRNAMQMAVEADICVFSGYEALPFEKFRLKKNLISFDMGERMLRRGWLNLASPRILKMIIAYHLGGWKNKHLYKLCMGAFTKGDQYKLQSFKGKCYKWGYFTHVDEAFDVKSSIIGASTSAVTRLMWCSRFLMLKHPELPILLAKRLKDKGYKFVVDMYGDEGNAAKHDKVYPKTKLMALICEMGVEDCVNLKGNIPNAEIIKAMREHDIFLFTSDRYEGWGAVANEAMSNGCVLVGSDEIGSIPYLISNRENGMIFRSKDLESLYENVTYLIDNPEMRIAMAQRAVQDMHRLWSPKHAAHSLLQLADDLKNVRVSSSIQEGPCSKA